MDGLTRRGAIGLGSAFLAMTEWSVADEKDVIVAGEKAALFKVKDVTLERIDPAGRTIAVRFGPGERPVRLEGLTVREDIGSLRVSHVFPGSVNNLPFNWDRLKDLVGKTVSITLRAESSRLSVDSIATAND